MAESVNLDINVNVPDAKKVEEPFEAIEKSGVKAEKTVSKTASTYKKFTDASRDLALKTAKTTTAQLALGTAFTGLGSAVGLMANKITAAEKPVTKMTDAQKDLNIKMQVQRDELQKSFEPLAKFGIGIGKVTSFVVESGLSIAKWTAYIGLAGVALTGFAGYKGWKSLNRHRDAMEEMGDTIKILSGHMGGLEEDWRQLVRNIALASEVEFDDVTETIRQMSFYLRQSGFTMSETEMFLIKLHQAFQIYGLTTEQTSTSVRKLTLALEENQLSMSFIKDLEKTAPLAFNLLAEAAVNAGHNLTKYGEESHNVVVALGELADQGKLGREVMLEFNKVVLESADIEKQWEERTVTAEQAFNRMGTAAREYFEILDWAPIVPLFFLKRPKVAATIAAFVLLKESAEEGFQAYHKYSGKIELERIKNLSGINKALDENIVKIGEATDSTKLLATFMDLRYGVHLQRTKNTNRNYKLINEASRELLGLLKEEEDLYTELYDTYSKLTDALKAGRVNEAKAHAIHAENIGDELKDIQIKLDLNEEYKKLLDDIAKKEAERARSADDIREKELPKKDEGILQSAVSHLGRIFGGGTAYAAGVEQASAATKTLASDNDLLIRSLERVQETENVLQGDRNINAKLSAGQAAELIGLINKVGELNKDQIKTAGDRRVAIVETGKSITEQERNQVEGLSTVLPLVTERLNITKQQAIAEKELEKTTKDRLKNEESVVNELAQSYLNKYEGHIKAEEARQLAANTSVEMEKRIFEKVALTLEQQKSKELIIKKLGETSVSVSTGMQQREIEHNLKILETNSSLKEQEKVGVDAKNKIADATKKAIDAEKAQQKAVEKTEKETVKSIDTIYKAEEKLQKIQYDGFDWRTKRYVEEHNKRVQMELDRLEAIEKEKEAEEEAVRAKEELARIEEENERKRLEWLEKRYAEERRFYDYVTERAKKYGVQRRELYGEFGKFKEDIRDLNKRVDEKIRRDKSKEDAKERAASGRSQTYHIPKDFFMGWNKGDNDFAPRPAMMRGLTPTKHNINAALELITDRLERGESIEDIRRGLDFAPSAGRKGISIATDIGIGGIKNLQINPIKWEELLTRADPEIIAESLKLNRELPDIERGRIPTAETYSDVAAGRTELGLEGIESPLYQQFKKFLDEGKWAEMTEEVAKMGAEAISDYKITDAELSSVKQAVADTLSQNINQQKAAQPWKVALENLINAPDGLLDIVTDEVLGIAGISEKLLMEKKGKGVGYQVTRQETLDFLSSLEEGANIQDKIVEYVEGLPTLEEIAQAQAEKEYREQMGTGYGGTGETGETEQAINEQQARQISLLESELQIKENFSRAIAREVLAIGRLSYGENRELGDSTPREGNEIKVVIDPNQIIKQGLDSTDPEVENALLNNDGSLDMMGNGVTVRTD